MKFYLYPYCPLVKGKSNSVILNLQRGSYTTIPNSLFEILNRQKNNFTYSIDQLVSKYGNKEIICSYFDFLVENQIGLYCQDNFYFQSINKKWEFPGLIRSTIISIDKNTNFDILKIINRCMDMGCVNLELRINVEDPFLFTKKLMKDLKYSALVNITCFIKDNFNKISNYEKLMEINPKLTTITFIDFTMEIPLPKKDNIFFLKQEYKESENIFITDKFFIDINFYIESLTYNPYLNKKVYISPEGNIKNDSYYTEIFGNICDHDIEGIITLSSFQHLWKINNDEIETLKDNPMRYSILTTGIIERTSEKTYIISNN